MDVLSVLYIFSNVCILRFLKPGIKKMMKKIDGDGNGTIDRNEVPDMIRTIMRSAA